MLPNNGKKQDLEEIKRSYKKPDPWGFKTNPEDSKRRSKIINAINEAFPGGFRRALDIGCGEGFISTKLPAREIHGFELSDDAASRLPDNVKRVLAPEGKYDLVVATGIMYPHYEWEKFLEMVDKSASMVIVFCNIADWEIPQLGQKYGKNQKVMLEFPYRAWKQRLRIIELKKDIYGKDYGPGLMKSPLAKLELKTETVGPKSGPIASILEGHHDVGTFAKAFIAEGWDDAGTEGGWSRDMVKWEFWSKTKKGWKKSEKGKRGARPVTVGYW